MDRHHGGIDELVRVLGWSGMETLIEVRAGEDFRVPAVVTDQLRQWFGEDRAASLVDEFPGVTIQVPNRRAVNYLARTKPLLLRGLPDSEIVRAVGCTSWTVRQHRARLKKEGLLPVGTTGGDKGQAA